MMDADIQPKTPLEVFSEWQRCLAANDQRGAAEVVDVEGYTEICLGLTEWTTGYEVAAANFLPEYGRPLERDDVQHRGPHRVRRRGDRAEPRDRDPTPANSWA
jgi:hypothetical protein